jgi:hypothetical protein
MQKDDPDSFFLQYHMLLHIRGTAFTLIGTCEELP